jgi:hypothetical protein
MVMCPAPLANDKAEGLQYALADALRKKLTGDCSGPNQKQPSLDDVAGKYLNQDQLKILNEAVEKVCGRCQMKAKI